MSSDLQLLQHYHETGDPNAFQSLMRNHAAMVYSTARRVTGRATLAEDAAQETFLELARNGRGIKSSLAAWLHRVAWRRACDLVRAESTRKRIETAAGRQAQGREHTWEEMEPVFDEALAEIPEEMRALIVEHYLEGRTQSEIAARLTMSQSSVSRLLSQGIALLRARLETKGIFCAASLGVLLSAARAPAAPATLIVSLSKLALSRIGGAAAQTSSSSGAGAALGLAFKTALGVTALAVVCAIGFDLASERSLLGAWFSPSSQSLGENKLPETGAASKASGTDSLETRQRLLAEAREIWAQAPKFSKNELERLFGLLTDERDPDKRFGLLNSLGIRVSRTAFDRALALHSDVQAFDARKTFNASLDLIRGLFPIWYAESPREAIAWYHANSVFGGPHNVLAVIGPWIRGHPAEWSAFVEAGPDPKLATFAQLWIEDLDDPGAIWEKAAGAGIKTDAIIGVMSLFAERGDPERALRFILRCPVEKQRREKIVSLAPRLSADQLLHAAGSGAFQDYALVNLLRAMAGDATASFADAANLVAEKAKGGGEEAQAAIWHSACIGHVYSAWLRIDPKEALRQSILCGNEDFAGDLMTEAAKSGLLDEAMVAEAFDGAKNRDRALAAFYLAQSGGEAAKALQLVVQSQLVEDQIEAAKPIATAWTIRSPTDAAGWLAALPRSAGHSELAAVIASQWAEVEPEAAFDFAQQYRLGLEHGWQHGFAWSARGLPEAKLAAMFEALRADPNYNLTLTRLVGWRHPSHPDKGLKMLANYGNPGWQAFILDDTIRWLQNGDSRSEDYCLALPQMDLATVDPEKVAQAAGLLMNRLASEARLAQALDWSLKLPPDIAAQSRAGMIAKLAHGRPDQFLRQWIQNAPIPQDERASLRQMLGK